MTCGIHMHSQEFKKIGETRKLVDREEGTIQGWRDHIANDVIFMEWIQVYPMTAFFIPVSAVPLPRATAPRCLRMCQRNPSWSPATA